MRKPHRCRRFWSLVAMKVITTKAAKEMSVSTWVCPEWLNNPAMRDGSRMAATAAQSTCPRRQLSLNQLGRCTAGLITNLQAWQSFLASKLIPAIEFRLLFLSSQGTQEKTLSQPPLWLACPGPFLTSAKLPLTTCIFQRSQDTVPTAFERDADDPRLRHLKAWLWWPLSTPRWLSSGSRHAAVSVCPPSSS